MHYFRYILVARVLQFWLYFILLSVVLVVTLSTLNIKINKKYKVEPSYFIDKTSSPSHQSLL